jgi:hypothetical protein
MSHELSLTDLNHRITQQIPVVYCKFGDGEYLCMCGSQGQNCDRTPYTQKLKDGLIQSYKHLIVQPDVFIAHWPDQNSMDYFHSLSSFNWINQYYQLLQLIQSTFTDTRFRELISVIKQSPLNKILVANKYMTKMNTLFNINKHHIIDPYNWFESSFEQILSEIKSSITSDKFILMTCGGMGSKVLIGELHKLYPSAIYLDFGSGFDFLCTKVSTRGWEFTDQSYSEVTNYLNGLLPDDWNDSKYIWIYEEAFNNLNTNNKTRIN